MSTPSMPPSAPPPSPTTTLSQLLRGSLVTQLIYVAATLGIADLLKTGARSTTELATMVGAAPQALYRVLRALASLGIFAETEPGWFTLTPLAEPLQSDVPGSLRGSAMVYGDRWFWQPCGELLHSVRTGQVAFEYVHNQALFAYLDQAGDAAASFNTHQTNMTRLDVAAILTAYEFAGFTTVVDVGGGHGALTAAIAHACPRTTIILFDQPAVAAGARLRLQVEGVAERCSVIAGDFFASVPAGGDAYVLKDIIHDWDEERALTILRNCHQAMAQHAGRSARLLVVEKVIPPGNAPFAGKLTDITMLLITGGRERTAAEYQALLEQAGFTLTKIVPTPSPASVIEAVPL
jgi:predicted O-methyltransferase YrrM